MDFSKFKIHDWLMIGGGSACFIFGMVFDWTSVVAWLGFSRQSAASLRLLLHRRDPWFLVIGASVITCCSCSTSSRGHAAVAADPARA